MTMKATKSKLGVLFGAFLLLIIAAGGIGFKLYSDAQKPVQSQSEVVIFTVEKGCYAKCTLQHLEEQGLIRNATLGYIFAKQNNLTDVCLGDYELNKNMDLRTILEELTDPTAALSDQVLVTLPEGMWASEIAAQLEKEIGTSAEELLKLWNDTTYVESLMVDYPFIREEVLNEDLRVKLEGYLFPNTYYFKPNSSPDTVTRKMLDETLKVYEKYREGFAQSQFSIHEVFTLASIVQYESGYDADNAGIAGVFINRINNPTFDSIGGYLQSNVTAQYAWNSRDVDPELDVNKQIVSLYNTYAYPGLPIGPVCNMGEACIKAVLYPEVHDYYYFLADKSGAVHYAHDFSEHLANINTYYN